MRTGFFAFHRCPKHFFNNACPILRRPFPTATTQRLRRNNARYQRPSLASTGHTPLGGAGNSQASQNCCVVPFTGNRCAIPFSSPAERSSGSQRERLTRRAHPRTPLPVVLRGEIQPPKAYRSDSSPHHQSAQLKPETGNTFVTLSPFQRHQSSAVIHCLRRNFRTQIVCRKLPLSSFCL